MAWLRGMLYPQTHQEITNANIEHPNRPFDEEKAWPEMYHRYLAGILGIGIAFLAIKNLLNQKHQTSSYLILGVLLFRAYLVWTVTMLLHPLVVLAHLLGGFSIATLLFYQLLPQLNLNTSIIALILFQIILEDGLHKLCSTHLSRLPKLPRLIIPASTPKRSFFNHATHRTTEGIWHTLK